MNIKNNIKGLQKELLDYILDETQIFNKKFIPIINNRFTNETTDNLSYIGHTPLTLSCKLNKISKLNKFNKFKILNYINKVKILISNGADVNIGDQFNNTPLQISLHYNNYIIFGTLLNEPNININAQNNNKLTILMFAIKKNKDNIVNSLIKNHNADINIADIKGNTPLHLACSISNINIINILLKKNVNINAQDINGCTPLFKAVHEKKLDIIILLINKNANVNLCNKKKNSPLHEACYTNNIDIVNQLLMTGAKINAQNKDGKTPIYFAIKNKSINIIELLIKKVDINIKDKNNETILHYICVLKDINLLPLIYMALKAGAKINERNKNGISPIILIIRSNNILVLKFLIRQKIDIININIKDNSGNIPLHEACMISKEMVEILINKSDINIQNKYGDSPLYNACIRKNIEIIKLLLQNGADINIINNYDGNTILHGICEEIDYYSNKEENFKIFELLLKTSDISIINMQNNENQTPLSIMCEKKIINIIKLLLDNGSDPNIILNGKSLFFILFIDNDIININIIKLLLDNRFNPNIKDSNGDTPLIHLCSYDNGDKYYNDIIHLLLDTSNININITNKYNHTPLYIACKKSKINVNIIKILVENGAKLIIDNDLSIYNELDIIIFNILIQNKYFSIDNILEVLNYIENKQKILYIIHIFIFYNYEDYEDIIQNIKNNIFNKKNILTNITEVSLKETLEFFRNLHKNTSPINYLDMINY